MSSLTRVRQEDMLKVEGEDDEEREVLREKAGSHWRAGECAPLSWNAHSVRRLQEESAWELRGDCWTGGGKGKWFKSTEADIGSVPLRNGGADDAVPMARTVAEMRVFVLSLMIDLVDKKAYLHCCWIEGQLPSQGHCVFI